MSREELVETVLRSVRAGHTFGEVANRLDLTRSTVAGIIWRSDHPWIPSAKPRPRLGSPIQDKILVLLADARPRATLEIARETKACPSSVFYALRRLEHVGLVRTERLKGLRIWWETPEAEL
jgi:hypothetical protein